LCALQTHQILVGHRPIGEQAGGKTSLAENADVSVTRVPVEASHQFVDIVAAAFQILKIGSVTIEQHPGELMRFVIDAGLIQQGEQVSLGQTRGRGARVNDEKEIDLRHSFFTFLLVYRQNAVTALGNLGNTQPKERAVGIVKGERAVAVAVGWDTAGAECWRVRARPVGSPTSRLPPPQATGEIVLALVIADDLGHAAVEEGMVGCNFDPTESGATFEFVGSAAAKRSLRI